MTLILALIGGVLALWSIGRYINEKPGVIPLMITAYLFVFAGFQVLPDQPTDNCPKVETTLDKTE